MGVGRVGAAEATPFVAKRRRLLALQACTLQELEQYSRWQSTA